jgi:hypothetical protein
MAYTPSEERLTAGLRRALHDLGVELSVSVTVKPADDAGQQYEVTVSFRVPKESLAEVEDSDARRILQSDFPRAPTRGLN